MIRTKRAGWAFAAGVAFVGALLACAPGRPAADGATTHEGTWRIGYVSATTIDFEMSYRNDGHSWDSGDTIPFDATAFNGLTLADIKSADGAKHFRIVRDAGSFDCNGYFAHGVGSGVFDFTPGGAFADALEARGVGRPSGDDEFSLAMADVSLTMVDRLKAAGISGLDSAALVRLAEHGVNGKYVADLKADGVKPSSIDDLVRLRDHGVDPDFVAGLARGGYHPSVDDLVRLRDHGVTAEFAAGLARYGYHAGADDLVRLLDHGVTLDFVARLQAHGYHPSIDDLIRLRDSGM